MTFTGIRHDERNLGTGRKVGGSTESSWSIGARCLEAQNDVRDGFTSVAGLSDELPGIDKMSNKRVTDVQHGAQHEADSAQRLNIRVRNTLALRQHPKQAQVTGLVLIRAVQNI